MEEEKIICDSDVIIDYIDSTNARHTQTVREIQELIGIDNVFVPALSKMEILKGALNNHDLNRISSAIRTFSIIGINEKICETALKLIETYHLSHNLSIQDSLIAATALEGNLKLFTYNKKDFRFIKGIKLY